MINIKDNLDRIKAKIQKTCQQTNHLTATSPKGKVKAITLLAVSKTKPTSLIEQAYIAGQVHFGENYLQEAIEKITQLAHLPDLCWHFIGPIQSNKTKQIASNFAWVHTLDREKIALRLNQHLHELPQQENKDTQLNVCLQVNISAEESKSGLEIDQLFNLAETVNNCDKLVLRGLMAIPEKNALPERYQQLQQLFIKLQEKYPSVDTLSLGMSNDLTIAIEHGSTMVRIGTAIFGQRDVTK